MPTHGACRQSEKGQEAGRSSTKTRGIVTTTTRGHAAALSAAVRRTLDEPVTVRPGKDASQRMRMMTGVKWRWGAAENTADMQAPLRSQGRLIPSAPCLAHEKGWGRGGAAVAPLRLGCARAIIPQAAGQQVASRKGSAFQIFAASRRIESHVNPLSGMYTDQECKTSVRLWTGRLGAPRAQPE